MLTFTEGTSSSITTKLAVPEYALNDSVSNTKSIVEIYVRIIFHPLIIEVKTIAQLTERFLKERLT